MSDTKHAMEAVVTQQLPVDSEGTPFYLYKTPNADGAQVEFYVCACGEQFGRFESAKEHLTERGFLV